MSTLKNGFYYLKMLQIASNKFALSNFDTPPCFNR